MRLPTPAATKHASKPTSSKKHSPRNGKGSATSKNANAVRQSIKHFQQTKERIQIHGFYGYYKGQRVEEPPEVRPPPLALRDLECVRRLGTGAYGSVLLVRVRPRQDPHPQDRSGSLFAMKVLRKVDMQMFDKHHPADTDSERETLCKLPWNTWINGVVGVFQDPINLYLMLECIPSGVLHDVIYRRGPLDASMARFYFANIVCAVNFLHSQGYAHRDLKPSNILIKPDGYITLVDFGLAKTTADAETWVVVGTPVYMAPELYTGQGGTGLGVDWFSCGVILYEMMTKRVPYYGKDEEQVYRAIASKKYTWPKDVRVGKSLKSIVAGLLIHDAVKRLGVASPVTDHPWLSGIDWKKMDGHRYIAPWIPGDVHLSETWQNRRLPSQSRVPGLHVVDPPERLRNDHRLPQTKKKDDEPGAEQVPPDEAMD